ncbi:hypothetical protein [Actinomyces sp.]|uniref:hypothetical protein n=1 Tax=Actinomyces sp. TaxID=29317 RepID=UPI0026DBF78C|nr:hypothetical protein [Actinomyces sp.]MDO4901389.1 hypothetical protein [Actinomyces sp.]
MSEPARIRRRPSHLAAVWATALAAAVVVMVGVVLGTAAAAWVVPASGRVHAAPPVSTAGDRAAAPLVVLGVDGLSWQSLREMSVDADARLAGAAATVLEYASMNAPVNLVQRTIGESSCPADGWLTLGAGTRARADASHPGAPCSAGAWADAVALASADGYGAEPGALARALDAAGASYAAGGDGAVLALTTPAGSPAIIEPGALQAADPTGLPDLTLIDLMGADSISDSASAPTTGGSVITAAAQSPAGRAVTALANTLEDLAGRARIVVVSVADPLDPSPQLAILPAGTASARGSVDGTLIGPTTHRPALIQLTDLAPTLLAAVAGGDAVAASGLGGGVLTLPATPSTGPGSTTGPASAAQTGRVAALADDAVHAVASNRAVIPVTLALLAAVLVLLLAAGASLRRPNSELPARLGPVSGWVAALPAGIWLTNLLPWWRAGTWAPTVAALGGAAWALGLAGVAGLATRLGRVEPPGVALLLAASGPVVIMADAALGAPLGFNGPLGMNAVVAGRFYGVSNTAFALAAGALVVVLAAGADRFAVGRSHRRLTVAAAVGVPGLAVLIVDGAPSLGADVGGALTLIPTLAALAAGLAGVRLGVRRWLGVGAATVGAVAVFALADYATGSRTHLGGFVQQALDGSAGGTLMRKANALIAPFLTSPLALSALVVGVGVAVVAVRWLRHTVREIRSGRGPYAWLTSTPAPEWSIPALRALAVLMVVEVVVNDSGPTMLLFSLAAALPALVAQLLKQPEIRSASLR